MKGIPAGLPVRAVSGIRPHPYWHPPIRTVPSPELPILPGAAPIPPPFRILFPESGPSGNTLRQDPDISGAQGTADGAGSFRNSQLFCISGVWLFSSHGYPRCRTPSAVPFLPHCRYNQPLLPPCIFPRRQLPHLPCR